MTSIRARDSLGVALDMVGDRWTLLIVRDLLRGRTRFSQLRVSVVGIASNVLTDRLRRLEANEIVTRRPYGKSSSRDAYILTKKGHRLGPVVGALILWGDHYGDANLGLIDNICGHNVELLYRCSQCDRDTPRSRLRIIEE